MLRDRNGSTLRAYPAGHKWGFVAFFAQGFVRGVTVSPDGTRAFSCGDDKAKTGSRIGQHLR